MAALILAGAHVTAVAAPPGDPWRDTERLQLHAGAGFVETGRPDGIGGTTFGVAAALQAGKPLWYSHRVGDFLQGAVHVKGTLALTEHGGVHAFADVSFAAEMFLLPWLSMEMFRLGLMVNGELSTGGPSVGIGMAIGGGWAVRPFDDPRIAIRLGLNMFLTVASTRDVSPDNDCPLCPSAVMTVGVDLPLSAL